MKYIIDTKGGKTLKFNLFGVDFSFETGTFQEYKTVDGATVLGEIINYSFDHWEEYGTITYRLILLRVKIEVKRLVEHHTVFA